MMYYFDRFRDVNRFDNLPGAMGWAGMIVMAVLWLLFLTAVILAIVWLARAIRRGSHPAGPHMHDGAPPARPDLDNAMRILNERYARGEIDDEEYSRRKGELLK